MKQRYYFSLLFVFIVLIVQAHPFYVSITSLDYNLQKKQLEVACRLFYDDLEVAIKNQQNEKIDIIHPKNKIEADSSIARYIKNNLRIKINGQVKPLKYVGYEVEEDVAWCYLSIDEVNMIHDLEINNQLLYQDYKSQSNIIHATVNKIRKSTKLDNPKRVVRFTY